MKKDGLLYLGVISKLKENMVWRIGYESGFVIKFNLVVIIIHLYLDSSCLYLEGSNIAQIVDGNYWSGNFNRNNEYNVGDNTVVDVEADMEKKVIFYFINNKQCPYYISDVSSSPLLFGINAGYSNSILEIISIKKMVKSSSDLYVPCEAIKWRK
jgi:hypothetical protein